MRRFASALLPAAALLGLVALVPRSEHATPFGDAQPLEEAKQDKPDAFQRFHAEIRRPDGADGTEYADGYLVRAYEASMAAAKTGTVLPWEEHGPANVAGRARALVRDVSDASNNTWLSGTAGGGIWKTTNGGLSWTNVSGSMPNLAVSALAQAPSAPSVWYAGTGEGFGNLDGIRGSGLFKSTDGGATWTSLASSFTGGITTVNRLVVSPTDANLVVAATSTGLYRSTDGGATWTRSTTVTASTKDLVAVPNFSVLVASVDGACSSTAPRLYRSTDGGATWALTTGSSIAGRRSELAIAPSDPQRMYATVEMCTGGSGLHVSSDAGATWTAVTNSTGSAWLGAQGWYDNSIAVHPFDPNQIFVGGIDLWTGVVTGVGTSPSAAFTRRTVWSAATTATNYIHADNHAIVPYVTNAATQSFNVLTSTDGGVFLSTNGGIAWTARNTGLTTTQFYGADKKPGAQVFVAGAQDNGSWLSPTAPPSSSSWGRRLGGDGFDAVYNDADQYIATLYNNRLYRYTGTSTSSVDATSGLGDIGDGLGPFVTHLGHTRAEPNRLLVGGATGMWRSDDFGISWAPAVLTTSNVAGAKWGPSASRIHAHVSMADSRVVWAGSRVSSNGNLFVSTDGGASYKATPNAAGIAAFVSGFGSHPADRNTAYVLFSVANAPKVLKTTDLGQTWTNLSGTFATGAAVSSNGFPNVAAYSLLQMPYDPNVMWAGTEIGLFVSTDGGASWSYANNGLPPVAIWQMKVVDGRVVVATHGRGVWSVAVPELAGYQHPRGVTPPLLAAAGYTSGGQVTASGTVRGVYDSLVVKVDGATVARLTGLASGAAFNASAPLSGSPARTVTVQALGYVGGEPYYSMTKPVDVFSVGEAVVMYSNPFDNAANFSDFSTAGPGFGMRTVSGFETPVAANLTSPYADNADYTFLLTKPIRVANQGAIVRFDEVALVEPCSDTSSTCTGGGFYDYVSVEASPDMGTWTTLAKYDSRAYTEWNTAYTTTFNSSTLTATAVPTMAMVKSRTVNLSPAFAAGSVVFLRFRHVSDTNTNGWGWLIDNLEVQPNAVANEAVEGVTATALHAPFPNPVRGSATVAVSMAASEAADVYVVDVLGRRVRTLHTGMLAAGTHRLALDASELSGGLYFVRLEAGNVHQTKGLTVVR